jgi:branched-chain amino acid transport system permease protein
MGRASRPGVSDPDHGDAWLNDNQALVESIIIASLLAFSVQVCLRRGSFSFASIGFYGIGSYGSAYLVKEGLGTVPSIVVPVVAATVLGWLLALILVRLRDLYLGMATIAFDLMVVVVAVNWTSVTGGPAGLYGIPAVVSVSQMLVVLVVVILLLVPLQRGAVGWSLDMAREDPNLAVTLGLDPGSTRRLTFALSGALGALAGTMHALTFYAISPEDISFGLVISILAMVIIGGFGSWAGALLGAIVLTYVPLRLTFIGNWWPVVYGALMIVLAVYVPSGLYGILERLAGPVWRRVRGFRREVVNP